MTSANGKEQTAIAMPQCPYCGCWPHDSIERCLLVKRIEYYPDGRIKSVEKKDG